MARGEARVAAMQLIYEKMLGGAGGQETLSGLLGFSASEDDEKYMESVLAGVKEKEEALDAAIAGHLKNWSLQRLARVDLAILRLAAYEILYRDDVPDAVAVNEAVDLSHR
ncbi:MAG: transcription antitermination factor NusB, partial [Firmicutes bacterium]|nr:transcription antitermination factor NusB [Bacillota bacterium]